MLSFADAQLVSSDADMPGLSLLLDSEAFAEAIRTTLPDVDVRGAHIDYLRYKPGTSCLAAGRVTVGSETVDVVARAYCRSSPEKLRKARASAAARGPLGKSPAVLEEYAVVVTVFPEDRRLESLPRVIDCHHRQTLLRRLFPEEAQLWNGSLNRLRYKPERRYVARLDVADQPLATLRFYTRSGYQRAWRSSKGILSQGTLRTARRLGRLGRDHVLAFEWLPGRELTELLSVGEAGAEDIALVGSALSQLHVQAPKHLDILSPHAEAKNMMSAAEAVEDLRLRTSLSAVSMATRAACILSRPRPVYRPIHGDFYSDQVLLDGEVASVVDLDEAVYGDPAADLGNFVAHLHLCALRGVLCDKQVDEFAQALLEGYRMMLADMTADRVEFHTAVGLLRHAPLPFRRREADWAEKTEELLSRANCLLERSASDSRQFQLRGDLKPAPSVSMRNVRITDTFSAAEDPDMPLLARALDPRHMCWCFQQHLSDALGGNGELTLTEIRVVRHKPGRRCLIEYQFERRLPEQPAEQFTLIGKARAARVNIYEYQLAGEYQEAGFRFDSADRISTAQPVGIIPELHMWFQQKIPGVNSFECLSENGSVEIFGRIAEAIHKFHCTPVRAGRVHTTDDELRILRDGLNKVIRRQPQWKKRISRVMKSCTRLAAHLKVTERCGIHRDFYPDQVLVEGERIHLLDIELYSEGDPLLDIGNFSGHLIEYGLRNCGNPLEFSKQQQVFEERYLTLADGARAESLEIYTTLTLVRHIYLSTCIRERRRTTEQLLDYCEQRLSGHLKGLSRFQTAMPDDSGAGGSREDPEAEFCETKKRAQKG